MKAPVSASEGPLRSLPGKLGSLLSGTNHGLQAEEEKAVSDLRDDLKVLIGNYLFDPSEVESPASTAHCWMKDVRDLSYDIDDFIYEVAQVRTSGPRIKVVTKIPRFKVSRFRFPVKLKRRQWITDEISGFNDRVAEAIRRHKQYLGDWKRRPTSCGLVQRRSLPSPCSEPGTGARLVGLDSSIKQLCNWLSYDGNTEQKVASIVGTAGVGKTTLAKEVYRKLGDQFDCLAFVQTSPKTDMKIFLTSILSQVRRQLLPDSCKVHQLALMINQHLQDKTYLIVIDDMWALSTWDIVIHALPKGKHCSRILITTEVNVVAQKCCADNSNCLSPKKEYNSRYMLSEKADESVDLLLKKEDNGMHIPSKKGPLREDESRQLLLRTANGQQVECLPQRFKYMPSKKEDSYRYIIKQGPLCADQSRELLLITAFGQKAECLPQGFEDVSNEIIKRSGGLPLAVKMLASLLARLPDSSIEQWHYIKNSLSSGLTRNNSLERINQVLNLAYDNLPHHMKACMLYLCMYEEDCVILKDDLVKQWIVEGLICPEKGGDGKEVARSCFDELVNRGLIQPVDINCNDEILSCSVHHMVLHFIIYKSMEENFSIAIDNSQTTIKLADKVRRLALHFGNGEDATPRTLAGMRLSKLRSLAFSGLLRCMPSVVQFRFLQVLILKLLPVPDNRSGNLIGSDDLSGKITEHDDLTDNPTKPDDLNYNLTQISELFWLRYFRLDACHLSVKLPTQMHRLKDLVAWDIDAEVTTVPSDIVDLPGMFYLSIPSEALLPTGIGQMTCLRTLGVIDLGKNSSENVLSLGELTNLQDLRLTCSTLQFDNLENNLECLGSIIRKLRNLKCVSLVPEVSSRGNSQNDACVLSMSTSWDGFAVAPLPPALLQTLELSRRCCIFSSLPMWIEELTKLQVLKISLRKVSRDDVSILKGLPFLSALSLFVWAVPIGGIMFDDEGFSVLKYFKFVCAAPCLEFLDGAMNNVRILKLGFNGNRMETYKLVDAGFERLVSLNEISTKIGCADDHEYKMSVKSVLTAAVGNHPRSPIINVKCVDSNFSCDDEKYIEAQQESEDFIVQSMQVEAREGVRDEDITEQDSKVIGKANLMVVDEPAKPLKNSRSREDTNMLVEEVLEVKKRKIDECASRKGKYKHGVSENAEVAPMMQLIKSGGDIPRMEGQLLLERILDGVEDPKDLPFELLREITDNFSEERKIDQGGFATVYKGVLGEQTIAVKRIHINVHTVDDKLFHREATSLMKINHRNVVRFLGLCSQGYQKSIDKDGSGKYIWANVLERLLCFEYISNGSLDMHITDELRGLEWEARYEIITGICKGLWYLHTEKGIIHMDLKPENILLDHKDGKSLVPKITNFGLSRPSENSDTMGKSYGTRGYWAPEYMADRKSTPACDIYSLGLIIIELVTGCKDIPEKNNVLRRWRHRWRKPPTQLQYQQVTRCMKIARDCRAENPQARPSISKIINFLRECGSTSGPIWPCLEDVMLRINPLELLMPSELNNEISHSVVLTNDTLNCMAFNIQVRSAQPLKGIVQPGSTITVKITVQARDFHEHYKFMVQSMKWTEGLGQEDIIECMSRSESVDEVDLMVVYEPRKPLKTSRSREDTNMPAEEITEAKKRKTGESSSGKGKNKIGSNENAEADAMDVRSSVRGQYINQLDRRYFHPPENFSRSQATNMTYLAIESDRAIDVTRGAMGSLLHKLGVLQKEFNLETCVTEDADELVNMQDVLRKVSRVNQDKLDDRVKLWSSNVREMTYDLEDFVDGFLVHSEPAADSTGSRELTHEMYLEKGESHQPIRDLLKHHINKKVHDAAKKYKEYNADSIVAVAPTKAEIEDLRISGIYIDTEKLVGIEMPRDELIRLLEEGGDVSKKDLRIVSIVGLGGLGKTTLAKAVYDKLKVHHNLKAFVSVGQNPDVKEVLKSVIGKFQVGFKAENLGELIEKLQELLKDKRYFIVIDDIWDEEAWRVIQSAFPANKHGSRVLTTTRNQRVALACCNSKIKYVYDIKPLSEEDSKRLFLTRIFGSREDCHVTCRKEEISKDILKICSGMPLAINSIASLLAGGRDSTWERVWKSLGAMTEENDLTIMQQILDLSYIHLPDHLKTCMLYVCMYPEDWEIDKKELSRKWVAEGFVHVSKNSGLDAEDVAEQYFEELINMCMIQPWKIDHINNEVLSCRVHDIIHDLLRSKSSKENFIHVIDGLKDVTGEIHRVTVQYNDKEDTRILEAIKNKGSLAHARSVLLFRRSFVPHFLEFKYVRVLHLADTAYVEDITSISTLFLLRYLKIEFRISGLPNQIGGLQQLETIDIRGDGLNSYPSDIVSLPWLSHLIYGGFGESIPLPDGVDRLISLRTLEGVCVYRSSVDNIKGLSKLSNLRKLRICSSQYIQSKNEISIRMEEFISSISTLSSSSLEILIVGQKSMIVLDVSSWSGISVFPKDPRIQELDLGHCNFQRCPKWISQLRNLYKVRIMVNEVANGVSIVAGLPSLAYLELYTAVSADQEESVVIPGGQGEFKALRHLCFHCPKASLTIEAGAMPKLEKLDMMFRYHMAPRFLPAGIENFPAGTLREISLCMDEDDMLEKHLKSLKTDTAMDDYLESHEQVCGQRLYEHASRFRTMMKRIFKEHYPMADIDINFKDEVEYEVQDNEDYKRVETNEKEDCCTEEDYKGAHDQEYYYSSEEEY